MDASGLSGILTGLAVSAAMPVVANAQDVIVVTGDRAGEVREESVLSLGVIPAAEIAEVAAQHPAELLNREAGVFVHRGNGAEHLTAIRSPVLTGGAGAGGFLYLEDGIPLRAAGFANVNGLFEGIGPLAGGVEVLRGPGPALYGSNALHGLVNTRTPDPADTASRLVAEAGSFGRYRGEAVLARPGEDVSGPDGACGPTTRTAGARRRGSIMCAPWYVPTARSGASTGG